MGKYFGSDDKADELFVNTRAFINHLREQTRTTSSELSHVRIPTNHGYVTVCLGDESPCHDCRNESDAEYAYAHDLAKTGRG